MVLLWGLVRRGAVMSLSFYGLVFWMRVLLWFELLSVVNVGVVLCVSMG